MALSGADSGGAGVLAASFGVVAQPIPVESHIVTVATGEWPPYVTQAGPHHGPMAQVIDHVFNDAGYQIKYIFQPWKRSKQMVLEGNADILMPAYCSPDRSEIYLCSDAVITGKLVLFHRIDMPLASDETNMRLLMKGRIQLYPQDKAVGFAMLHHLYPPNRWSEITSSLGVRC
ncbi:MAG TPA: hypothetical protein ENH62_13555 [Marinobacter sp.]|uniref:Solute-binding protein family 3/N-terminal domain-containing protein n=2 Tax=root TaxID=1 RepID=A0A831W0X6_9GAMM|nr:hypothetical protein [Marinobacter antarcticus]HDZ39282.1 hypothetical protein [Marinobacter sp.]HEA53850.1 hypothetical protein [Marinobacter antarcticus]